MNVKGKQKSNKVGRAKRGEVKRDKCAKHCDGKKPSDVKDQGRGIQDGRHHGVFDCMQQLHSKFVHIKLPQKAEPPSSAIVLGLAALNSLMNCLRRAEPPKHASVMADDFKLPLASSTHVAPSELTGIAAPLRISKQLR
jgi:hypothetical protein